MIAVTRVTGRAVGSDELSEGDYRDIFDELRRKTSLRKFSEFIGSAVSFAWWGAYENGEKELSQDRKNELRRIVGLPALPPTVKQATEGIDPDATVWSVGGGIPDRVVMVGRETHEPLLLRLNGALRIVEEVRPGGRPAEPAVLRRKRAMGHVVIRRETWERLNRTRLEAGLSWEVFLGQLLGS
jgi:hypothetical protein